METSLKTGFAQISLAAQKIRVAQNLGGLQPPQPPPARTPMDLNPLYKKRLILQLISNNISPTLNNICFYCRYVSL